MTDTACSTACNQLSLQWFRPIIVKLIHDKKAYNFEEKFMEKNWMPISYHEDGLIAIAH